MTNKGSPAAAHEEQRISGNVVIAQVSISGITISVNVSGQPVDISGHVVDISGQPVTISGNWVDINGAVINASISGQVVYVGETYVVQQDTGSSVSVMVSTAYIAPQPLILDAVNLDLISSAVLISGGVLTVEVLTSSAVFTFVRNILDYRTYDHQAAKSVCFYPDRPLCVMSGDVVSIKYANDSFECAEARLEAILRLKV